MMNRLKVKKLVDEFYDKELRQLSEDIANASLLRIKKAFDEDAESGEMFVDLLKQKVGDEIEVIKDLFVDYRGQIEDAKPDLK